MTNLDDYYERNQPDTESRSGFSWRKVALASFALAVLVIMGFLFTTYPLEIIILLLFVASVFFMERK